MLQELVAIDEIKEFLNDAKNEPASNAKLIEDSTKLAKLLLGAAKEYEKPEEVKQAKKLAPLIRDADSKAFAQGMTDKVFRSNSSQIMIHQMQGLLNSHTLPNFLSLWEKAAIQGFKLVGPFFPGLFAPIISTQFKRETDSVIKSAEPERLMAYLDQRQGEGFTVNVNLLGEAVLGEGEANRRLDALIMLLSIPQVKYISVKWSAIYSQFSPLSWKTSLASVKERLRVLYRACLAEEGGKAKFVNLDMESYKEVELTLNAFKDVLMEEEFLQTYAGIVLQAYLPDASGLQVNLTDWARERKEQGGGPVKIRLVKGANLSVEKMESTIMDWEVPIFSSKAEVDANYKSMLEYGLQPENLDVVHVGVASHNLFDISYAILKRNRDENPDRITFEMLEGMANPVANLLRELTGRVILYAPVVDDRDFQSGIAYLVRRLDENTTPGNFLREIFDLKEDSPAWNQLEKSFTSAFNLIHSLDKTPRRKQNRKDTKKIVPAGKAKFKNSPDTDFSLPDNRDWAMEVFDKYRRLPQVEVPLQIAGEFIKSSSPENGSDPSRPNHVPYVYSVATLEQVEKAVATSVHAGQEWAALPQKEKQELLTTCAENIEKNRGELLGAMLLDVSKAFTQGDPEVSEAIDFANYYRHSLDEIDAACPGLSREPIGPVVIAPPWNFPLAIPAGGIFAALIAGNTVLFKPAPEAILTAWDLVRLLWKSGIPKDVLQFVPCRDDETGKLLITHDEVKAVILTGSLETANMFRQWKPHMKLLAETSGKNSMIITPMADMDLAIGNLVTSAFGHSGQKCSAASLAICLPEVYDDPEFFERLKDTAGSLTVGVPWKSGSKLGPLTQEPSPDLNRALTQLEAGETWLLEPHNIEGNPKLWSPGIRLGVKPGSWFHKTECFGPVLGIMRAPDLKTAIEWANATSFGLTSGIQSLDVSEQNQWQENIKAGNLYINRSITGAIVRRQPFGGWKDSSVGPGAKAGGPNYTSQFVTWSEKPMGLKGIPVSDSLTQIFNSLLKLMPLDLHTPLLASTQHYNMWFKSYFSRNWDPSKLEYESNIFRYRPCEGVLFRVTEETTHLMTGRVLMASLICGIPLELSVARDNKNWDALNHPDILVIHESLWDVTKRIQHGVKWDRYRCIDRPGEDLQKALNESNKGSFCGPVFAEGRLELLNYLREQSLSTTNHRYGNLNRQPLPWTQ